MLRALRRRYLSTECQFIAQGGDVVLQEVDQPLKEGVILTFHISIPERKINNKRSVTTQGSSMEINNCRSVRQPLPDTLSQDVFVEAACEVTLQQSVIVHRLGHHAADELEVTEMVRVAVRRRVDGISDPVAGRGAEQSVHGVKHLSGDDHVPLSQQAAGILTFLSFEHDVPENEKRTVSGD